MRLFLKNNDNYSYNNFILQQAAEKPVSIAIDVFSGIENRNQEAALRIKVYKISVIDTEGLPYEINFAVGKYYIITRNIDVTDGLANDALGKLVHLKVGQTKFTEYGCNLLVHRK